MSDKLKDENRIVSSGAMSATLRQYLNVALMNKGLFALSSSSYSFAIIFLRYVPPLILGDLINKFIDEGEISLSLAWVHIALIAASRIAGELIKIVGQYAGFRVASRGQEYLHGYTMQKILKRDYTFFSNNFAGSITKKALDHAYSFIEFWVTINSRLIPEFLPIVFVSIILFRFSPWLVLIQLSSLVIVTLVAIPVIRRRMRLVRIRQKAGNLTVGVISDIVSNVNVTKAFAEEKREAYTFSEYVEDWVRKSLKSWDYQNVYNLSITPIYTAMNTVALIVVIQIAAGRGLQPGDILVVFSYFFAFTRFLHETGPVYRDLEGQISKGAEFTEMFDGEPMISDISDAAKLNIKGGELEFADVSFKYEDEDESYLLTNFSLKVPVNQTLGLVGPSGGGKTTLTKLILRFIDITDGSLMIDGQDIRNVTQESLRKNIGYVPQEPLMFHRTIADNIRYGNPKASQEEVEEAAKLANAHEFIVQLKDGYETLVGERGIKLSGGQRQRVAIARAFLKDAPVLLLDEATSALDSESEKLIQASLFELMKGKTTVVIAHRLSTIKHLDRIIVLDNGKIVQDGTHDELSKAKGLYKQLWSHQSGGFLQD